MRTAAWSETPELRVQSGARAQLALGEWRKVYAQALRAGKPSEIAEMDGADAAALNSLGYVEAQASSRAPYELPPPGEHHR